MENITDNMKWRMSSISTPLSQIPEKPGLYAIGHRELVGGLEKGREYVYIGQTKNLRRRLNEHSRLNETKEGLRLYLSENQHRAMCWYTIMVDESEILSIEKMLIRVFDPEYNH